MKSREVLSVPVDRLVPDPEQPRKVFSEESLLGLAKTLKDGQLHPILAYRRGAELVILDGERRWRAAKLAGLTSIDVIVVDQSTPEQSLERALVANLQREDLSPIEKARGIDRLMKATGCAASRVAVRLGLSPGTVSRLLALLELPESVQGKVERGEIAASTAYQISRSEAGGQSKEQLAAEVVEKGLSRQAFAAKRKAARRGKPSPKATPPRVVAVLAPGRSVTVEGLGLASLGSLIEWLEELLGKARSAQPAGLDLSGFTAQLRKEARAARSIQASKQKPAGGAA